MKRYSSPQILNNLFLALCAACFGACGSDEECFTPPTEFALDVRGEDGRSVLSLYETDDIQLYYLDESDKRVAVDFRKEGVIISSQLPFLSMAGENPFFLELDAKTDTLEVDVRRDRSADDNCTAYFFSYVGINGESATVETLAPNLPPVFIISR